VSGFNHSTLLGHLIAPPEELYSKAGKLFIKAIIAVSVHRKNADGQNEEHTSYIPATAFGKTAELFGKYVQKGDMVHLAGRLDSNEWKTDDGSRRLSLSFVVEQLNLLPNGRANAAGSPAPTKTSTAQANTARASTSQAAMPRNVTYNEFGEPDDIPFRTTIYRDVSASRFNRRVM
jgi:single-strand DNA-binding protein